MQIVGSAVFLPACLVPYFPAIFPKCVSSQVHRDNEQASEREWDPVFFKRLIEFYAYTQAAQLFAPNILIK